MALIQGPFSRIATQFVSGLVSIASQTFAGAKTFTSALIASAGIQLASLWNTNGGSASDVCVKVGTNLSDGSVNATAKLLQVSTGIGGTEVPKWYVDKTGSAGPTTDLIKTRIGSNNAWLQSSASGTVVTCGTYFEIVQGANINVDTVYAHNGQPMLVTAQNGTLAAHIATKVGTTTADASVNASAKLLSVRTGIGATEAEYFGVTKAGITFSGFANSLISCNGSVVDIGNGGTIPARATYFTGTGAVTAFYASAGGGFSAPNTARFWSETLGNGATDVLLKAGAYIADGSVNAAARLLSLRTGLGGTEVEKAAFTAAGRLDQSGTDSSGTPGVATINKPTGKSAIAAGASSVVITNSLVTAASSVIITPHARDTTCKELIAVPAAGSFTVSGTANATAALSFSWRVSNLI